ncbi:hypothetical protein ABAC460_07560 [Asticcacaulis sp. AC460]|nr:hypothetical protein ABAC460_07560 [Asticcacaulis sp. AC460]
MMSDFTKVLEILNDLRPALSNEEVEAHFDVHHAAALGEPKITG